MSEFATRNKLNIIARAVVRAPERVEDLYAVLGSGVAREIVAGVSALKAALPVNTNREGVLYAARELAEEHPEMSRALLRHLKPR